MYCGFDPNRDGELYDVCMLLCVTPSFATLSEYSYSYGGVNCVHSIPYHCFRHVFWFHWTALWLQLVWPFYEGRYNVAKSECSGAKYFCSGAHWKEIVAKICRVTPNLWAVLYSSSFLDVLFFTMDSSWIANRLLWLWTAVRPSPIGLHSHRSTHRWRLEYTHVFIGHDGLQ